MLDFTAIDFETANAYRGSPCSVGLVRVRDGQIVDKRHWLIRPPEGADRFDPWNVAIHGITSDMVANVPRWKEVLPLIVDFVGDDVLVAHNAAFDTGVMRYACEIDKIDWPEFNFLCTLVMSRHALDLPTYRLPYVVERLGFVLEDHHDALADALAVVKIIVGLAARQEVNDLNALAESVGVRVGTMSRGIYRGSSKVNSGGGGVGGRGFTPVEVNPDADPGGYLYGRVVVFTGALDSMTRDDARQECAKVGGIPEENTTKRTNVLVVGNINPSSTGFHRGCFPWFLRQPRVRRCRVRSTHDEPRTVAGTQALNAIVAGCTSRSISTSPPSPRSTPTTGDDRSIRPYKPSSGLMPMFGLCRLLDVLPRHATTSNPKIGIIQRLSSQASTLGSGV